VRINGQFVGATPTVAEVKRNGSQNVTISKEGFKDQHVNIKGEPDTPWFFWDFATCIVPIMLCIPVLVDAISGAWLSVDERVRVKLEPLPQAPVDRASPYSAPMPTAPAPMPTAPAPMPTAPAPSPPTRPVDLGY